MRSATHHNHALTLTAPLARLIARVNAIEHTKPDATLTIQRGTTLHVSSLNKLWFPNAGITKGDVMRYYIHIAPYILPLMKDRALALKRFPNGVPGEFFFQQKASPDVPSAVRVETIINEAGDPQKRLIGGSLVTLLYCTQLGAFEVNPWNTRVSSPNAPDFTVIDLDPGPRTPFARVVETATWVKDALDTTGLLGAVKTSGSTGIHIFIPLPPRSTEQTAERVATHIATLVVQRHPRETTTERVLAARGPTKVYIDTGQNALGKTVACAYSVRATPGAFVSAPLYWEELTDSLKPESFTVETLPQRLASVGDLWGPTMRQRNSARSVTKT